MGGSQIRIVRKRKPDGPAHGRHNDPPPKNWGEEHISGKVQASANQLADKVGRSQKFLWPMDAPMQIALAACSAGLWAFEEILDATEDEGRHPFPRCQQGWRH